MADGSEAGGARSHELLEIHAEGADSFEEMDISTPQSTSFRSSGGSQINVVNPDASEINRLNEAINRDNNRDNNLSTGRQHNNSQYSRSANQSKNYSNRCQTQKLIADVGIPRQTRNIFLEQQLTIRRIFSRMTVIVM